MQEKKISEKESLKLIMTMIDQTKTDDGRHSGDTMLIWGYLTTLLGLGIYGLTLATNTPQWNLLWLSLPFVGFLSSYLFSRQREKPMKTYVRSMINQLWMVIGTAFMLMMIIFPILGSNSAYVQPLVLLFCSVGVSVSGLISQERLLTYLPFLPFCLGLHLLVQLSRGGIYYNSNLWFALGFVVLKVTMLPELNPLLHSQLRLAVISLLSNVVEADFVYLKEKTQATAGNLSVQIEKLGAAGYIHVEKTFAGKKPRTVCRLTSKGKQAFEAYVQALQSYISTLNP